jgi:hypothetical protein
VFEWIRIDSRPANRFIAIAGVIYAVAALVLLLLQAASVWDGASLFDRMLEAALLMAIIGGAVFVVIARANLRRLQR